MTLQPWDIRSEETIVDMEIFQIHRVIARSPRTGEDRRIALVTTGNWINVVALTPEREVVLVRQYRHGTRDFTLEIPGGLIDPGEGPAQAAARELREETGYAGGEPELLGVVEPNPAFLDNRCYTYLIENCRLDGSQQLDDGEDIEVLTPALAQIPSMIADGTIRHALVVCGFWWLAQRAQSDFTP